MSPTYIYFTTNFEELWKKTWKKIQSILMTDSFPRPSIKPSDHNFLFIFGCIEKLWKGQHSNGGI